MSDKTKRIEDLAVEAKQANEVKGGVVPDAPERALIDPNVRKLVDPNDRSIVVC